MLQPEPVRVAVALGSNLENPADQVHRAFTALAALADTALVACSPLYRSKAIGPDGQPVEQPDFCNAAALLDTRLSPHDLLNALQAAELAQGRVRQTRGSARSLDLDLLVYGDLIQTDAGLTVPHPRMTARNFVMFPLRDIAADMTIPGLGRVRDLAAMLDSAGLRPWQD